MTYPTRLRHLTCPLAITLTCIALILLPESGQQALEWQRDALLSGQLWRLVSGHLTHLNGRHLIMNLAGVWMIWLFFLSRENAVALCLYRIPVLMIGVSLTLLACNPEVAWYRGLSGILHGLLVMALLRQCQTQRLTGGLLLALLSAKIVWEQTLGAAPGSEALIEGRVIVDSHLYGAIWGGIIWLLEHSRHYLKKREVTG